MFLNDAFSRDTNLNVTCFHHEQSCTMAAESYYKTSSLPVVVNVTTGPGATNAITGVYGAYVDSSAMIVVSGQVKRETLKDRYAGNLRQLGDQEVDIISIVKPITKYAVQITDPEMVEFHLEKAYFHAMSGRPGPVWIDIPVDVQAMKIPKQSSRFRPERVKYPIQTKEVEEVLTRLEGSVRPVIIAGTGVHQSKTAKNLIAFANKHDIPVVTSFCASDLLPGNHRLHIGRQGTIGDRAGNFAVQNADVVLILGARMNIRQVSYAWDEFARDAFKIMVDIDQHELDKPTLNLNLKLHGDLRDFFALVEKKDNSRFKKTEYLKWCLERKENYPVVYNDYYKAPKLNPYVFMKEISRYIGNNSVIVTANGAAAVMSFQAFETKKGQRLFSNSGSAPMGLDLPGVIGVALALKHSRKPNQRAICFAGDGSIMMNLQELQTIYTLRLPITVFIINNQGYLSILQTQKNYFKDNIFGCRESNELSLPNFEKVSKAFNLKFLRVKSLKDMRKIGPLLRSKRPNIVEVVVDETQGFEPKLVSKRLPDGTFLSPKLDDMYPFLSDEEYQKNRINR